MAALTPCRKRPPSNIGVFCAKAVNMELTITARLPNRKIRLRPYKSARRPKIITNMALAIKYAMGIQLSARAPMASSLATAGRATLTDDNIKGVLKELSSTMMRTLRCSGVIGGVGDVGCEAD